MTARSFVSMVLLVAASCPLPANAHDPSAWGGLFRSRDDGASWFPADAGLFIGAALGVAVHPQDGNHLLYGTDTRLLRSRNGGRDWVTEAPNTLIGAVFAVAFAPDGIGGLASSGTRIFYSVEGSNWQDALAPAGAAPARAFVNGSPTARVYLAGAHGLFASNDGGRSWSRVAEGVLPEAPVGALLVVAGPPEIVYAVIDGKIWAGSDGGKTWHARGQQAGVDTLIADSKRSGRLWSVAADQVFVSDDAGGTWKAHGRPLPEKDTSVRGLAVAEEGSIIVLSTHRGVLRSADGGQSWVQIEGTLPVHLEAGPLVRDRHDAATLYAGFSLTPYAEMWRRAEQGGSLLSQLDTLSLAGGLAFLILLLVLGIMATRWLSRRFGDTPSVAVKRENT
ncbi:MAG TPA: hypothetical protein VN664_01370 [Burkholderiales bacterium]|nr:hypothetical protein [Burkholderiales bacterium]